MLTGKRIAIIGSGTMGRALAGGLLRSEGGTRTARLHRPYASAAEKLSHDLGLLCSTDNADAVRGADIVVLCLKPKDVAGV